MIKFCCCCEHLPESEIPWRTGICDCHRHPKDAFFTAVLPCVTFGRIAEVLDRGQLTCVLCCFSYLLMMPCLCSQWILAAQYRRRITRKYNLKKDFCGEALTHICCPCCALCQEYREIEYRKSHPDLGDCRGYNFEEAPPTDGGTATNYTIDAPNLSVDELEAITHNFGPESFIGEGSHGVVYHGVLGNGKTAALKKLGYTELPDHEFLAQVAMVSRVKHENFNELLGYCVDGALRVLAYEYAPHGSLHDVLHGEKHRQALPKLGEKEVNQCVERLNGEYPPKAVAEMAAVAALCVQREPDFRPGMSKVVRALQTLLTTPSVPAAEIQSMGTTFDPRAVQEQELQIQDTPNSTFLKILQQKDC